MRRWVAVIVNDPLSRGTLKGVIHCQEIVEGNLMQLRERKNVVNFTVKIWIIEADGMRWI